ncbi:hypothetical protein quinque_002994 [Culex quinquefasciatus]
MISYCLVCVCLTVRLVIILECQEYRAQTVTRTGIIPLISRPVPVYQDGFDCVGSTVDVITGGTEADEGEFPHQALLGWPASAVVSRRLDDEFEFLCGGTLVSDRFVLTAGHCTYDSERGYPVIVRLGEHNLDNDLDHQIDFDIREIVKHPSYRANSAYHDIALIELKRAVRFSRYIRPACLWTSNSLNYTMAIATGYGQLGFMESRSRKLTKVTLKFFTGKQCGKMFPSSRKMRNGVIGEQLCAGSSDGRDTCQGDSGGPLQVKIEERGCMYHVVGITSRGNDACGLGQALAIYTKVSSYVNWIERVVWNADEWIWY